MVPNSSQLNNYVPPKEFKSKARQARDQEERRRKEADEVEDRRVEAMASRREEAVREAVDAHLAGLTDKERARIEREAIEASKLDPKLFRRSIIRAHVIKLLELE